MSRKLDIVTVIANPIGWNSRIALARYAIGKWLEDPDVRVTLVESAYGSRTHELADLKDNPRINYVPVRSTTLVWNKESLLNIGIWHLPHDAEYIGTFDADIEFRRPGWGNATIRALDLYPVVQPWDKCYDLGPNDEHIQMHASFASVYVNGGPLIPNSAKFWKTDNGPYDYPHSGYAWAWQRKVLDRIGGLFEVGGVGSGDHHMALSLVGQAERSVPGGAHPNYLMLLKLWQERAMAQVNGKIGFVHNTIEHCFHGSKVKRGYVSRWDMFIQHQFDPIIDLKRNTYGVLEFAGNKPELEKAFDLYLRSRMEDCNAI